jgi:hypothetical protein
MINIFSSPLYAVPGNPLALYLLKHGRDQQPFDPEVPVPEVPPQGVCPGGQALDPVVLGQELGVAV